MKKGLFHIKKRDLQKGAVSVFLVIILVPCIVISSMFVDLSRVNLSKGVAVSAADLALNSLMANYDADLSEYYGLMASCQNIEQFYDVAAMSFLDALYSQGLNADDTESLLAQFNALMGSKEVHDLFQMEVQTETSAIVSDYKDASLGTSPVIIKDQIVDFMKYRGPIEITTNLIDRLSKMDGADQLLTADQDEQLVEKKKDYADAEESFMDHAYDTYKEVLKYDKKKITVNTLKSMLEDMKKARETYREIVKVMVSNLNGTTNLEAFKRPTYKLKYYNYTEKSTLVHSSSKNGVYSINKNKIEKLLKSLNQEIIDFKNARKTVEDKVGDSLINADVGTGDSQYNPIQWWKKVSSLIEGGDSSPIGKFKTAALAMLKAYSLAIAIEKCTPAEDVPEDWKTSIKVGDESKDYEQLIQSVKDLQKDYLTAGSTTPSNNRYIKLVNKLEKHSGNNASNVKPGSLKLSNGKTVSASIKDVQTTLSGHVEKLDGAITILNDIIKGKGENWTLDHLGRKAKKYNDAYEAWRSKASNNTTPMEQQDWQDIQDIESKPVDTDGAKLNTNQEEILLFKDRVVAIRDRLVDIRDTIKGMKLGKKNLVDIDVYDTAYNAVKSDIGENTTNAQIKSKAAELFKNKFTPYSADKDAAVKSYNFSEALSNPQLSVNPPKFYTWMIKKFKDEGKTTEQLDEDVKQKKKEKKEKKKEAEEKKKAAEEATRDEGVSKTNNLYKNDSYKGSEFPSGLDGTPAFGLGSGLAKTLGTTIDALLKMDFSGMRDSLYATEYVMDMFSYATYSNEGRYHLYKDLNNGKAPTSTAGYKEENVKKQWNDMSDLTFKGNQTLTNKKINSDNNILYGAEAEYVLYGKSNTDNIKSAYTHIFEIRYLLNTLSGFANFWTATGGNTTALAIEGLATTISGLTSGIVPVPVIKVVAILLLTALETVKDLDRLQDGFPVELYKSTDEEWHCTIDEGFSVGDKTGSTCENGLFYSDYIYLFLYMGFQDEKVAPEMYLRIADLVQVNMRKATGDDLYSLKNSRAYFQLNATIRVNPLMLALPYADGFSNNPKETSDWCTFKISEIRGYS